MHRRTLWIIGLLALTVGPFGAGWVWGLAQDALFIDDKGNVGIGKINPTERLDVDGGVRAGNMLVGPWPAEKTYAVVGAAALDQAKRENYALLQAPSGIETGFTYLNSPAQMRFRLKNEDRMKLSSDGSDARFEVLGRVEAKEFVGHGAIPKGGIVMWSGAPDKIPDGWCLCDGKGETPNLSGRFIAGYAAADGDYQKIGNTGGEKRHTLTVNEMPSHTHTGRTDDTEPTFRQVGVTAFGVGLGTGIDVGERKQGNHNHSFTTAATGGGQAFENRPPYFVLAYIQYRGAKCQ